MAATPDEAGVKGVTTNVVADKLRAKGEGKMAEKQKIEKTEATNKNDKIQHTGVVQTDGRALIPLTNSFQKLGETSKSNTQTIKVGAGGIRMPPSGHG